MKKIILILILTLSGYTTTCFSQTKQESIKELLKIMKQDSIMDKVFSSTITSMINQTKSQFSTKDSLANVRKNEIMNYTMQAVKDISKKILDEDIVIIYDKYFTQSQINDYITFYKSPSGQKLINATPYITKDIMTAMMQKYMPEIQETIKKKFEDTKNPDK